MNIALDHWHIEPSGICTLKCPRCPRAEESDKVKNKYLTLKFFKEQIGLETIQRIKKITFCGNTGDPIYCRDLIDITEWIKLVNPNIQFLIVTNGSHKKPQWWKRLAQVLTADDEIHLSIDGWDQESNEKYRIACDWDSIITGITEFKRYNTSTYTVWAAIAFAFNEHNIDTMIQLAKELDFDLFQLTLSTKFGSKYPLSYGEEDALEPINKSLIPEGHRFTRETTVLSNKKRPGSSLKEIFKQRANKLYTSNNYPALCYIGNKGVFLNSSGEFYPCCWVANNYKHNATWINLGETNFNLHKVTFQEILQDKFWNTDFLNFNSLECQNKCTKDKLLDTQHTTEW